MNNRAGSETWWRAATIPILKLTYWGGVQVEAVTFLSV